ncbi:MAG: hypothetical protein QXS69_03865 [Candidatus Aenigmatarchaeota archaeon]
MEANVEEVLQFIGKVIRKIDEKMEENPIGAKLLSKEEIKTRDLMSIVNKIAHRYIYYLSEEERKEFRLNKEKLSQSFWKDLEILEKEKKIKFYIFIGYVL